MKGLIERAIKAVDIEQVTKDFLETLTVKDLELYFVVRQLPDVEDYEFVGLAYSEQAAGVLWLESAKGYPCKILRLDIGKALTLAEKRGLVENIQE